MLEGDADYTVSQPPLFALGPGWSSCQFILCLCLGETITSNFVPEFDDLGGPQLAANMVRL